MAEYRVTRSKAKRRAEQKAQGVKDGTIRKGAKGRTSRRWNEKTARWEKMKVVEKKGMRLEGNKTKKASSDSPSDPPSDNSSRPGGKNLGLGGNAAPYRRPGQRPAQEKVVNVKPGDKKIRHGLQPTFLTPKSSRKIPTGRIVLRGNPPKKYQWNGERWERYSGPRPASNSISGDDK